MEARLKTRLSCPKGPPPDAVRMYAAIVEPAQVSAGCSSTAQHSTHQNEAQGCCPKLGPKALWGPCQ